MKAYCACIYGLGGSMLDPAGGMATLNQKIHALGVDVADKPWDQTDVQGVADFIKKLPPDASVFLVGDSCGANKAPWVAAAVAPRKIAYIACIQASTYCNDGCPAIGPNVGKALVIFSDWAHTGGLGVFIPPLATGNKTTKYRQKFIPAAHPDDQDPVVQNMVLADIKAILAAQAVA